jgi:hypothetical protein
MPQDVQTNSTATSEDAKSDTAAEHFSHLHKMSTTAGVTNQEYVAVNPLAVVAALLGVASGLSFFGWLLMVIPIAGIIFAIVAIRQIADSNGTQTGRGLAIVGLALCLLCAAGMMVQRYLEAAAVRNDEQAIAAAMSQTGRLIGGRDYKSAYAQFDDDFQQRFPYEQFQRTWETVQSSYVGKVEKMEWNGVRPVFQSAAGSTVATAVGRIKFQNAEEERYELMMRKVGNKWLINALPAFFRERGQQQRQQRPADQFNDPRLG